MRLVLMGAPGAGKGTQAEKIQERLVVPNISTGEIFRYHMKNDTPLGKKAREFIDKGNLVPDDVTEAIVEDRLMKDDCENGFILDGFPRTIAQAVFLGNLLKKKQAKLDCVLNISVDDDEIIMRLSGRRVCKSCGHGYHIQFLPPKVEGVCDLCAGDVIQRDDDSEETVISRIKNYHSQTEPLIEYYRSEGLLRTVLGKDKIGDTTIKVFEVLGI